MAGNEPIAGHTDRGDLPKIMVVANDLTLLKLVNMALSLEVACDVLTFASGKSAEETAKSVTPDLFIIDEHLLDLAAGELADQLHSIKGLERVPTLIVNAATVSLSESQSYPMILLRMRWKIDELYAAVYELLGRTA
jgi:response regulator RpfG family c-di-GMP phosphodiesterase